MPCDGRLHCSAASWNRWGNCKRPETCCYRTFDARREFGDLTVMRWKGEITKLAHKLLAFRVWWLCPVILTVTWNTQQHSCKWCGIKMVDGGDRCIGYGQGYESQSTAWLSLLLCVWFGTAYWTSWYFDIVFSFSNKYLLITSFIQGKFWMIRIKWESWISDPLSSFLHLLCVLRYLDWISRLLCSLASGWVWPMGGISKRWASSWGERVCTIYSWAPSLSARLPRL